MNGRPKKLLEDVWVEVCAIAPKLGRLAKKLENEMYVSDDLSDDDRLRMSELRSLRDQMNNISHTMEYLQRDIVGEGILQMQENGRYEVDGHELSSGSPVEIYVRNEFEEREDWFFTRIEHSTKHGGYYACGCPEITLQGAKARVRSRW